MRVLVKVTKKHIANGKKDSPYWCPVALACIDAGYKRVIFGRTNLNKYSYREVGNSRSVRRFVAAFDAGKKVKPFNFFLNV